MKLIDKLKTGLVTGLAVAILGVSGHAKAGELNSNKNYVPAPGQVWVIPREKTDLRAKRKQLPENVVVSNGKYYPAQGYTWNEEGNAHAGVRKIINDTKQSIINEDFKNSDRVPQGKFYFFAANYWKDFNGDRKMSPNEYVGIKKRFREDEKLMLVSHDARYGLKGSKIKTDVYSPNGDLIDMVFTSGYTGLDTSWNIINRNTGIIHVHGDLGDTYQRKDEKNNKTSFANFLSEKGGYGNYKAVLKLDGKYLASTEFEIVPSLRSKEVTKK